jgi:hypothetical protein
MTKLVDEETGLRMMICRTCKRARMREARSKKENENIGWVYVKCLVSGFSIDLVFCALRSLIGVKQGFLVHPMVWLL